VELSISRECLRIVDIADMVVSSDPEDTLVTYSLGSCVGMAIYDQHLRIGGMIHCMLPLSKLDPQKAAQKPAMFVDTGVPALLQAMFAAGSQRRNLVIKIAGAASPLDENGSFRIGERNLAVLRKLLWKNELLIGAEDTGGAIARTLYLRLADGLTMIRADGQMREL